MRIIGLTGGVATGKSSVARFLSERGITVIDADTIAREAVFPGTSALQSILEEFGSGILLPDGTLDRKALGAVVFSDGEKRHLLERILHPAIKQLAEQKIRQAGQEGSRVVIYMAPLLIEAGASDRVDEIWVVSTTETVQIERLMARDNISREEAKRIIESQMPLAEKERFGRIVIDNSGTEEQTMRLLEEIMQKELVNSDK
jgi:dephospho-CoA kinase